MQAPPALASNLPSRDVAAPGIPGHVTLGATLPSSARAPSAPPAARQVLLYLPVVHAGREAFFARHADAAEVLVLGAGSRARYKSLAKDIRALPPALAARFLQLMLPGTPIRVIEPGDGPWPARTSTSRRSRTRRAPALSPNRASGAATSPAPTRFSMATRCFRRRASSCSGSTPPPPDRAGAAGSSAPGAPARPGGRDGPGRDRDLGR